MTHRAPMELAWRAALSLLREAQQEINSIDMCAQGSMWTGNELAFRIDEFLKSTARGEEPKR